MLSIFSWQQNLYFMPAFCMSTVLRECVNDVYNTQVLFTVFGSSVCRLLYSSCFNELVQIALFRTGNRFMHPPFFGIAIAYICIYFRVEIVLCSGLNEGFLAFPYCSVFSC